MGGLSVAEEGNWEGMRLLKVSLIKELLEQEVRPFGDCGKGTGLLRYITGMKASLKDELLRFE